MVTYKYGKDNNEYIYTFEDEILHYCPNSDYAVNTGSHTQLTDIVFLLKDIRLNYLTEKSLI
jgi:hypothetical protein